MEVRDRSEKAEQERQRERALLEDLVVRFPGEPYFTFELGEFQLKRGDRLRRAGKRAEAEEAYRQALPLTAKLVADETALPLYRCRGPYNLNKLGDLCWEGGRRGEAEETYQKALTLSDTLIASSPTTGQYKEVWLQSWTRLGELLATEARRPEAVQAYRRIINALEGMVGQSHAGTRYKGDLAKARSRLIDLLVLGGDFTGAAEVQQRVVSYLEERARKSTTKTRSGIVPALPGLSDLQEQESESPAIPNLEALVKAQFKLAELLRSAGRGEEADRSQRQAIAEYRVALNVAPNNPFVHNGLAWVLATYPDPKLRDPGEAVRLAKRAVELAHGAGELWNTLGVAHYRAGEWQAAVAALNKSMDLRKGGDSFDWLFLAMAHWQLGDKDEAQKWIGQAVEWMDKNKPQDEELRRFRAEAADLLGIQDQPRPKDKEGSSPKNK